MNTTHTLRRSQRGMTLIELAVGLVIALLVGLAATGSAQMFTASQRQSMSAGSASMNIASTLAAIKNDVAGAGLGFFGSSRYLCDTLNLSLGNAPVVNGTQFSPVALSRGPNHDTVAVVYGDEVVAGANVLLKGPSSGTTAMLRSLLPMTIALGETPAVLMLPRDGAGLCTVRTATSLTPADPETGSPLTVAFGNAGLHNQFAFANAPNYQEKDLVALLGTLHWHRYRVDNNNQLILDRVLEGDSAVLARNVVAFRAEFGVASDPTFPRLDSWVQPQAFGVVSSLNIKTIRAVRLSVVTRSPQPEKAVYDPATGTERCMASVEMPRAFPEDATPVTPDLPEGQWQCHRYRTATVVVPLRNVIW